MGELTLDNYETTIKELWQSMKSQTYATKFQPAFESSRENALAAIKKQIEDCRIVISTRSGALSPSQLEEDTPFEQVGSELMNDLQTIGVSSIDSDAIDPAIKEYSRLRMARLLEIRDLLQNELEMDSLALPDWLNDSSSPTTEQVALPIPATQGPTLSEAWQQYRSEKITRKKWRANDRSTREYDAEFRDMIELNGADCHIAEFTRENAQRVIDKLHDFPKNRRKTFKETPLINIPEEAPRISTSTVRQRVSKLSSFFKWAVTTDLISKNPFDGLSVDAEKTSYATYTDADIKELFDLPQERINKSWQFWIPRIALYTGARQNEIAQLLVSDIKLDPSTKICYFNITDDHETKRLKTRAAKRQVPIHPVLIQNGFIKYYDLAKSKGESLWPGLTPKGGRLGQRVSEYWGNLKNEHNLLSEQFDDRGGAKVFHSLRRVVINRLRYDAMVEKSIIQALVGHEQTGEGETLTYLDGIPLAILSSALEKLSIADGLVNWEHPKKFEI